MKIVISIDSFKDSISSFEAGHALQEAIKQQFPDDIVKVFPLADGGEGTVTAMTQGLGGKIVPVEVMGPLGEAVSSRYGYLPDNEMAIIEMADSSGLPMVPVNRRNPMDTTTYGLGQLIAKAMDNGCKRFIIGIGGSATNDCGLGMLTALGYDFYKADGTKAGIFGKDLADIASIDTSHVNSKLKNCVFQIACDVNNPLCGLNGCSYIYGPQKGATPQIVTTMDEYISDFAQVAEKAMGRKGRDMAGAGAAGGLLHRRPDRQWSAGAEPDRRSGSGAELGEVRGRPGRTARKRRRVHAGGRLSRRLWQLRPAGGGRRPHRDRRGADRVDGAAGGGLYAGCRGVTDH